MIRFLFASDSFKGSLTSEETAALLTKAAHEVFPDCVCVGVPIADGGEGTVDAVIAACGGEFISADVHDPLMNRISTRYGITEGGKAVIEMSAASGLTLVSVDKRDPMETTTFGTGELILDALDKGCRDITVAIGGSATNDGGMGCMRALGARFIGKDGRELEGRGKDLSAVARIDLSGLDKRIAERRFTVMCDVDNPLCGENGAVYTFAQQKGATSPMLAELEIGMINYRDVIKRDLGIDCDGIKGAGAAGGLGAALSVFCNAEMRSGIETALDIIGFDNLLDNADVVITGEGRADAQSCRGKVMQGVGRRALRKGVPAVGLCGSVGEGAEGLYDCGIISLMATMTAQMTLEYAMENAEKLYYEAAVRMFRLIRAGKLPQSHCPPQLYSPE